MLQQGNIVIHILIFSSAGIKKLVVSLVVVDFMIVIFVMVVFVLAHCRNMQYNVPHGATAAEVHIFSSAVVHEGSSEEDAIIISE